MQTYVLGLVVLVGVPLVLSSLGCRLFARATTLPALVPSTVELCLAYTEAVRANDVSLVASGVGCRSATSTGYVGILATRGARAGVAFIRAQMSTSQNLIAGLVTVWDGVLA